MVIGLRELVSPGARVVSLDFKKDMTGAFVALNMSKSMNNFKSGLLEGCYNIWDHMPKYATMLQPYISTTNIKQMYSCFKAHVGYSMRS